MAFKDEIKHVYDLIDRLEVTEKRLQSVQIPILEYMSQNTDSEERVACYGLDDAWKKYAYLVEKVCFRMRKAATLLSTYLKYCVKIAGDGCAIPPDNVCHQLAFECEDMIIATTRLYDEDCIEDLIRYIPRKDNQRSLRNNLPKKNDIDGLYWRINLLRNRMAHSTGGAYSNKELSHRFMDFTSQIHMIYTDNGAVCIECNLIDLELNPQIKRIIKDVVIDKKLGEKASKKPVYDILFPENTPKGHGKSRPQMLWANIGRFDYNHGFISLAYQILDFIDSQVLVFLKAELEKCGTDHYKRLYIGDQELMIEDIYDFETGEYVREKMSEKSIVSVPEILFPGKRKVNWDDVEQYMAKYRGKSYTVESSGDVIYLDKRFEDEYCGSVYSSSLMGTLAKAKANAAQIIPELIQSSENKRFKENLDEKHSQDASKGWYRYDVSFQVPVCNDKGEVERYNIFRGELIVRHASNDKMYLYDMVRIKKKREPHHEPED